VEAQRLFSALNVISNQRALSTLAKLFNALGFVEEWLWDGGEYAAATTKIA